MVEGICGTTPKYCAGPSCQLSFGPACDGNQVPAGADTSKVPRPTFGNVSYGVNIRDCSVSGKVALTFDDGPYIYTTELLDLLNRNKVQATFFIVGNNAGKGQINDPKSGYGPIIKRMIAEGHQVGSHSWSHQALNESTTPQQRRAQIINNEIAINSILGVIPTYFRPPYTRCWADCLKDLKSLGYHVVCCLRDIILSGLADGFARLIMTLTRRTIRTAASTRRTISRRSYRSTAQPRRPGSRWPTTCRNLLFTNLPSS